MKRPKDAGSEATMVNAGDAAHWKPMERFLSDGQLAAFTHGSLQSILAICRDAAAQHTEIDIQIRDGAITIYEGGSRVAHLKAANQRSPASLAISEAYLEGTPFRSGDKKVGRSVRKKIPGRQSRTVSFPIDDEFVGRWRTYLETIIVNAERAHRNPEGRWEARVLAANRVGTPLQFVDRQIQIPRRHRNIGAALRLDAAGIADVGGDDAFIVVELKQKQDPRIEKLFDQITNYAVVLGGREHQLRDNVAASYRRAAEQRRLLNLPAVDPNRIRPGMPIYGLVVLAEYNDRSSRLADAVDFAAGRERAGGRPVYAHVLRGKECVLPPWPWDRLSQVTVTPEARTRQKRAAAARRVRKGQGPAGPQSP